MKLDTRAIRYLTGDDWRVLAAVEQGSRNHELVPTPLISQIAGLRAGSAVHKCIANLAKAGLIAKLRNAKYDGYRLTYGGLDYLALNTHRKADVIYSLGNQIGVGKESDIYITASPTGRQQVLKLHRLGRISFRTVKSNRDYLRKRNTGSWMYLSRLAAQKEHAFMKVLHREGFPVPEPIGWSRHTIVMEFIDSFPLRMIDSVPNPGLLYAELMEIIVRLAKSGLIHGDFNEFNLLIKEEEQAEGKTRLRPILIDFPQAVSIDHTNAEYYFDRDVACVKRYFERRFKYTSDEPGPFFKDAIKGAGSMRRLDVEVEASGFSKKMAKELERYVEVHGDDNEGKNASSEDGEDDPTDEDDDQEQVDDVEDEIEFDGEQDASHLDSTNGGGDLHDDLASVSLHDAHPGIRHQFSFEPLSIPTAHDVSVEQIKVKKKAAGWSV